MCYMFISNFKTGSLFLLVISLLSLDFKADSTHSNKTLHFILNNGIFYNLPSTTRTYIITKENLLNSNDEIQDYSEHKSNVYRDNRITITNNQSEIKINEKLLLEAAKAYRSKLKLEDFMLDIFIEDESNMRLINYEQLGRDRSTDIISIREDLKHIKSNYYLNRTPYQSKEHYHLGEIFICPKYIKRIAEQESIDETLTKKEFLKMIKSGGVAAKMQGVRDINMRMCLLLAHGILHLLGYDHITEEDYKEMTMMEDSLLEIVVNDIVEKMS